MFNLHSNDQLSLKYQPLETMRRSKNTICINKGKNELSGKGSKTNNLNEGRETKNQTEILTILKVIIITCQNSTNQY